MALVTIGMPVYARPNFLTEALESLLAQTFRDFVIILSDDASPDPLVRATCEDFAARDGRVRYVRQPRNIGHFANHLHVFEQASSRYFLWASEDDLWEPLFLERGVRALEADPARALWFCQADAINRAQGVYLAIPSFTRLQSRGDKRRELIRFLFEPEILGKSNLFHGIFRRDALAQVEPLLPRLEPVWGWDNAFIYAFLCRHDCMIDSELLFHKRADTDKPGRVQRWARLYVYPLRKAREYLSAYNIAAAGTPYAAMTRMLLPLRFATDQAYKLVAGLPALAEGARRALARIHAQ